MKSEAGVVKDEGIWHGELGESGWKACFSLGVWLGVGVGGEDGMLGVGRGGVLRCSCGCVEDV